MKVLTSELAIPIQVTITISPEEAEKAREEHWTKIKKKIIENDIFAQKVKISGFRRGKEPRELIEAKLGNYFLYEEKIHKLFSKALSEKKMNIIDVQNFQCAGNFNGKEEYLIRAIVYRKPKIIDLALDKIKVDYKKPIVREEEVNEAIEQIRHKEAKRVPVNEELGEGKQAIISYKATIDGKDFPGSSNSNYVHTYGRESFLPTFDEVLKGRKAGEVIKTSIEVPKAFLFFSENEKAEFEITIKEIIKIELPEINEKWLSEKNCKNIEQLKIKQRHILYEQKENLLENEFKNNVISQLAKLSQMEAIPEGVVEKRIDTLWKQTISKMQMSAQEWANSFKITEDELETRLSIRYKERWPLLSRKIRDEMMESEKVLVAFERFKDQNWERAVEEIRLEFLIDDIAERQKFEISDQELKDFIDRKIQNTKFGNFYNLINRDSLDPQKVELINYAKREKVIQWVLDKFRDKMQEVVEVD